MIKSASAAPKIASDASKLAFLGPLSNFSTLFGVNSTSWTTEEKSRSLPRPRGSPCPSQLRGGQNSQQKGPLRMFCSSSDITMGEGVPGLETRATDAGHLSLQSSCPFQVVNSINSAAEIVRLELHDSRDHADCYSLVLVCAKQRQKAHMALGNVHDNF